MATYFLSGANIHSDVLSALVSPAYLWSRTSCAVGPPTLLLKWEHLTCYLLWATSSIPGSQLSSGKWGLSLVLTVSGGMIWLGVLWDLYILRNKPELAPTSVFVFEISLFLVPYQMANLFSFMLSLVNFHGQYVLQVAGYRSVSLPFLSSLILKTLLSFQN